MFIVVRTKQSCDGVVQGTHFILIHTFYTHSYILYSFIHFILIHTFYTHSYILKGEDRPWCVGCHEDITVKHILLHCVDFSDQRPRFYSSPNLKHLFIQVPGHQIVSFLKAIGLYGKF